MDFDKKIDDVLYHKTIRKFKSRIVDGKIRRYNIRLKDAEKKIKILKMFDKFDIEADGITVFNNIYAKNNRLYVALHDRDKKIDYFIAKLNGNNPIKILKNEINRLYNEIKDNDINELL